MTARRHARWKNATSVAARLTLALSLTAPLSAHAQLGGDEDAAPALEGGAKGAAGGGSGSDSAPATPSRITKPAPSVTPTEKILADSVVSFPVDI